MDTNKSTGKVTIRFDFSHCADGQNIGIWLRDIARDGTISVLIQALWECGEGRGYYAGKLDRATTAATRTALRAQLKAADGTQTTSTRKREGGR